jgi:phage shock protein A
MNILRRTTDILSANLNDLIDHFEQPEKMLRHGLREMESSLDSVSSAVARSIAAERLLQKEHDEHDQQAAAWGQRAAAAVEAADDGLARRALARKHEHLRLSRELEEQLTEARAANSVLRSQIDLLRQKHAAAHRKLSILSARQAAAMAHNQFRASAASSHFQLGAADRFQRHYQKLEMAEAEATALAELHGADETLAAWEFERQVRTVEIDAEIDAELAALKQRHA